VLGDMFYIQNRGPVGNCVSWWAVGGHGYTCDIRGAWIVDKDTALRIVQDRPEIDTAWPVNFIDSLAVHHVDIQRLTNSRKKLKP
jgi:hypothetical protein